MRCRARTKRSKAKERCKNDADVKYLFLYCKDHKSHLWKRPYAIMVFLATVFTIIGFFRISPSNLIVGLYPDGYKIRDFKLASIDNSDYNIISDNNIYKRIFST